MHAMDQAYHPKWVLLRPAISSPAGEAECSTVSARHVYSLMFLLKAYKVAPTGCVGPDTRSALTYDVNLLVLAL